MSGYENTDPMVIAKQAERDLNSQGAKQGTERVDTTSRGANGASDSSMSTLEGTFRSPQNTSKLTRPSSQPSSPASTSPLSRSSPAPK